MSTLAQLSLTAIGFSSLHPDSIERALIRLEHSLVSSKMASFSIEEFVGDGVLKGLHDRALMQYGDRLESSGKCLSELLHLSTVQLSSQFGMKRGHIARFMDRTSAFADHLPKSHPTPATRTSSINGKSLEQSLASFKIRDGYIFKGIVAMEPAEPRACGCVQPDPVADKVAPYSTIENISVQKLTPEYKIGMEHLVKTKTPPMKASELWRNKPAVILCIRRPGVLMQIKDFWPRYWGGVVLYDRGMEFFKALGGGKQFIERNFGDWAPPAEVIEICAQLKNQQEAQEDSFST